MAIDLAQVKTMTGAVLATGQIDSSEIREHVAKLRTLVPGMTDAQVELVARELEEVHSVTIRAGSFIKEEASFKPWLDEARKRIEPFYYWSRYRQLLEKAGYPRKVLSVLDQDTDQTLDLLENPEKPGPWDRRGLVMGHVQSGKTTNYTGLICKAADAGYKVVIVIAGIHNNLRRQTQMRIDEGFIGFDSAQIMSGRTTGKGVVGVGHIDRRHRPSAFTNTIDDFRRETVGTGIPLKNLRAPAVFVVKKNVNTLGNLLGWLTGQNTSAETGGIPYPMLLIDDEADNASINIMRGKEGVSRINGLIRSLLRVFDRRCYVGYTATPFANIFIEPDSDDEMFGEDLFPRDFVMSLDPSNKYFGATRVFVEDPGSVIRDNSDNGRDLPLKHPKGHQVAALPESLRRAVRTFVVARAIRLVRGHETEHNSMLVNVSRFTEVQRQVRNLVHDLVNDIRGATRVNGELPPEDAIRDPEMAALRSVFDTEYAGYAEDWADVQKRLYDSVAPVGVVEVNSHSRSRSALNYSDHKEHGLNVIAVGGFSLSRGLTLEGLVVSYFLRNSMMYDTLMQMGRWFGYRGSYHDLCRVWMLEEAAGWYSHITDSIEELREDLRRMQLQGGTPKDFGLRVRSHPDTLTVTARNKMGSATEFKWLVGLANRFIETWQLDRSDAAVARNLAAAQVLAEELRKVGKTPILTTSGWLASSAPVEAVLRFVSTFKNHPASMRTDPSAVCRYIEQREDGQFARWDVLFASVKRRAPEDLVDRSLGFEICCQRRAAGSASTPEVLHVTDNQRVASRGVEKTGLTPEQARKAEEEYRLESSGTFPDRIYRRVRERPLLIVHLLAIGEDKEDLSAAKPVVAWSISVPQVEGVDTRVEYIVNTTWLQQLYDYGEEDESAGDDD